MRSSARGAFLADCANRIAARDQNALSELYEATVGSVYSAAQHILGDRAAAEEVVSDVYFQFWREADRYDPARCPVNGWLLVLCRSRARDAQRRLREEARYRRFDQDGVSDRADEACGAPEVLAAFEEGTLLHLELESLIPQERHLLALAFFRGLTHREIAEREGIPLGTVKSHIRNALIRLRRVLRERGLER